MLITLACAITAAAVASDKPPTWDDLGLPEAVRLLGVIEHGEPDPLAGPDRRFESIASRTWTESVVFDRRSAGEAMASYTFATPEHSVSDRSSGRAVYVDNTNEFAAHGAAFGASMLHAMEWVRLFETAVHDGRAVAIDRGAETTVYTVPFGYSDRQFVHLTVENATGRLARAARSFADREPSVVHVFTGYEQLANGAWFPMTMTTEQPNSGVTTTTRVLLADALPPETEPAIRLLPRGVAILDVPAGVTLDRTLARAISNRTERYSLYQTGLRTERLRWIMIAITGAMGVVLAGGVAIVLRRHAAARATA